MEWIHNVFHVSILRKYISDLSNVLEATPFEFKKDLSFEVQPMEIVDHKMKELRNKIIPMVMVLWRSDLVEEMS